MIPAYKTIFDITNVSILHLLNSPLRTGPLLAGIGLLLLLLTMNTKIRSFLQGTMHPAGFPVRVFLIFFTAFALSFTWITFQGMNEALSELKQSLVNGEGWITAGKVEEYLKVRKGNENYEVSFKVNKIMFNYSDDEIMSEYHDITGPLKEGLTVRIYYFHDQNSDIKNKITKLEIAE